MKNFLLPIALAALSLGAQAQVTFSGGTDHTSIVGYDPNGLAGTFAPLPVGGKENALVSTSAGTLTATFLGFEALDTDHFTFAMGSGTLSNMGVLNATILGPVAGGALNFTFSDLFTGTSVSNGQNLGIYTSYAVLGSFSGATFTPYTLGGAFDLILGFNDGQRVDADFDDMVVGLKVTAVPEPETYALLLAGLGTVGLMRRRKTRSA